MNDPQSVDLEGAAWDAVLLWCEMVEAQPGLDLERRLGLLLAAITGALFEVRKAALVECRQGYKNVN